MQQNLLPFFIHIRISAKIVVTKFRFWWCYFKCIFLTSRIICRLHTISLQTCHSYSNKNYFIKNLQLLVLIFNNSLIESYPKRFCCHHPNRSTNKHLSKRNNVSTKLANGYLISVNIQSSLDVEHYVVVNVNYVY